ncbi:MAG: GNAT family N-acetyltransferase [Telluria sp.]
MTRPLLHFAALREEDASDLLAFELRNRAWFESLIDSRGDAFYSEEGVLAHIKEMRELAQQARMLPLLVRLEDGTLVGRVNLRDIDPHNGSAELGYRVDHACGAQGIATAAVGHILARALDIGVRSVSAIVAEDNAASARVLTKHGFTRQATPVGRRVRVGTREVDAYAYVKLLADGVER